MPKPKKNEEKNAFISRCMRDNEMKEKFDDNKQRLAVCYTYWGKSIKENTLFNFKSEILNEFKIEAGPQGFRLIDEKGKELSVDNLKPQQEKVFNYLKPKLKKDGFLAKIGKVFDKKQADIVLMPNGVRVNDESGKQLKFYQFK